MHTKAFAPTRRTSAGLDLVCAGGPVALRSPYYELVVVDAPDAPAVRDATFGDVYVADGGSVPLLVSGYLAIEQQDEQSLTLFSHDAAAGTLAFSGTSVEVELTGVRSTGDPRWFVSDGGIALLSLDVTPTVDRGVLRLPRGSGMVLINGPALSKQEARLRLHNTLAAAAVAAARA